MILNIILLIIILLIIILLIVILFKNLSENMNNQNDLIDLNNYEKKIYSQNGEDGITEKLIDLLYGNDKNNKYYVEFGVENGTECNTRILREKYNWNGLLMDGSNKNTNINLQKEFLTKENIVSLFKKYNVPKHIHLLCVDIDFNDFYLTKEILKEYESDIIIVEYNSTHLSNEDKIVIYNSTQMWDYTNYFSASLLSYTKLLNKYNYTLVYCNKNGVNAFYINNKFIDKINKIINAGDINKIYRPGGYGLGPNGGHPSDPQDRPYIKYYEAINL
jgi:hypothetical protein